MPSQLKPVDTEEGLKLAIAHRMLTLETSSSWEGSDYLCKVVGVTRGGASIHVQAGSWEARPTRPCPTGSGPSEKGGKKGVNDG